MRQRTAAIVTLCTLAYAGAFAACGLDESGQLAGDASPDITIADVVSDTVNDTTGDGGFDVAPLSCEEAGTALDASCVGVPIPTGWTPIAYRENSNGCNGVADFTLHEGITDASVPSGQCFCSDCNVVGSWSCSATVYTGPSCPSNAVTYTASACDNQFGQHFGATAQRLGDAGCAPGSQVDASIAATSVSLCSPTSCSADFCGLVAQGFLGCVINTQAADAGCPSGFAVSRKVAPSATASCTCPQCGVTNTGAGCTGMVTAMSAAQCGGNVVATQPLDGGCFNTGTGGYMSMYYDAGPVPTPACGALGPATGSATLDSPTTVCCTK